MVRFATSADKAACIRLLRESHEAAGFVFKFQAAYASALFDGHMSHNHACVLVFDLETQVQGVLMVSWFEHPFGAGRYAKETVWYVAPIARGRGAIRMLDAYETWARDQNCVALGMASLVSNDVSRLYERRGFTPVETHFVKSL